MVSLPALTRSLIRDAVLFSTRSPHGGRSKSKWTAEDKIEWLIYPLLQASILRQLVAGPRLQHPEARLDLCYVTDNSTALSSALDSTPNK